jgi:hypothetical protein
MHCLREKFALFVSCQLSRAFTKVRRDDAIRDIMADHQAQEHVTPRLKTPVQVKLDL